jgi:hypothetical protein
MVLRDRQTGASKGSAFCWYSSRESADAALSLLHGQVVLPDPAAGGQLRALSVRAAASPRGGGGGVPAAGTDAARVATAAVTAALAGGALGGGPASLPHATLPSTAAFAALNIDGPTGSAVLLQQVHHHPHQQQPHLFGITPVAPALASGTALGPAGTSAPQAAYVMAPLQHAPPALASGGPDTFGGAPGIGGGGYAVLAASAPAAAPVVAVGSRGAQFGAAWELQPVGQVQYVALSAADHHGSHGAAPHAPLHQPQLAGALPAALPEPIPGPTAAQLQLSDRQMAVLTPSLYFLQATSGAEVTTQALGPAVYLLRLSGPKSAVHAAGALVASLLQTAGA